MSLVRLNSTRITRFYALEKLKADYRMGPGQYSLELNGGDAKVVGGKSDGEVLTGDLAANQTVDISLGILRPTLYHALVSVNPELLRMGTVSAPVVLEPKQDQELVLRFRAHSSCSLKGLPYIVRIYGLE